jgi:hypothetical protein
MPSRGRCVRSAAIDQYGIDMTSEFRTQGATQYGTITKSRFNSIVTTTFGLEKGFLWDDATLDMLNGHYGTGADDLNLGGKKQVAWMDVCEDLGETDARTTALQPSVATAARRTATGYPRLTRESRCRHAAIALPTRFRRAAVGSRLSALRVGTCRRSWRRNCS